MIGSPDVAAPVCARPARAPGMGPVGLPWPGPGFGQGAGTEVPPVGARRSQKPVLRPRASAPWAPTKVAGPDA